jgi:hypothetical protein
VSERGQPDWAKEQKEPKEPEEPKGPRTIAAIARETKRLWKNVYFGAVPYLQAMHSLDGPKDVYGADSAESIVAYFLANAQTWRGPDAKRIKAELKALFPKGRV